MKKFEDGVLEHGRDFALIQSFFLPEKSMEDLVLYYYSIWKQLRSPRSQEYYAQKRRGVEDAKRKAEILAKEAQDRRKRQCKESKQRRLERTQKRKIRDTVKWLRTLSQNPDAMDSLRSHPFYSNALKMVQNCRNGIHRPD